MKKIVFIFILSFLVSGCYIRYPSVGVGAHNRVHQRPHKVRCKKFLTNHGIVIKRCHRHYR